MDIPESDPLIELLYGEKRILNSQYTYKQLELEKEHAQKINELMEREIFDSLFFEELQNASCYKPIEKAYSSILEEILERVTKFEKIKDLNYHLIVTGGVNLRNDSNDKDVFILLEWPLIKFVDLINTSVLCAKSFEEYYTDCKVILNTYKEKYIDEKDINLYVSLYDEGQLTPIQYQIIQLFQQIQSVFILAHELGHLLHLETDGVEGEIKADLEALKAVQEYTFHDKRLTVWIIISIMLLYSYLILLDISLVHDGKEMMKCREKWLDRYDAILEQLQMYTISFEERQLIDRYDDLCSLMDCLCIEIIESSSCDMSESPVK